MRNTLQHPITADEIVQCLEKLSDDLAAPNANGEYRMGDMRPLLLRKAAEIVGRNGMGETETL